MHHLSLDTEMIVRDFSSMLRGNPPRGMTSDLRLMDSWLLASVRIFAWDSNVYAKSLSKLTET